jgi:hypothetical protein
METKGFRLTYLSISAETNWLFKNHGCEGRTNKLVLFSVPAINIERNYGEKEVSISVGPD